MTTMQIMGMVGIIDVLTRRSWLLILETVMEKEVQARGHEAAVGITWFEFKELLVEECCLSNIIEKLEIESWNYTMVGFHHAGYTNRFHELAKLVPHLSVILKAGILTDEVVCCGTVIRSSEKRKEVEETSKQGGLWKDNKKEKVGKGFVATAPPRNENVGSYPKCVKCSAYHPEDRPCRLCFNGQKPGYYARDSRALVKQVAQVSGVTMGNNQRVVRIPLEGGEILRVQRERTLGGTKTLVSTKADKPKLSDIPIVRDFTDLRVYEDDIPKTLFGTRYEHFEFTVIPFGLTNAPAVFMDLINQVCKLYKDKFVIVFIDDFLIYSKTKEDHEEVHFLGHAVNHNGIHVDPSKIKAVKKWKAPTTLSEIRSFSGLVGHYQRFIANFSKIAKPLTSLTKKNKNDYECEIRYHPGKANIVADALSTKERVKYKYVRAIAMIIQSGVKRMILASQSEVFKQENAPAERLHDLEQQMEKKEDESLYSMDCIWVPLVGAVNCDHGRSSSN
uniref:Putative reverse transcriptase domain-containing protein n=1 Tax=Tanacetum cinerariifolium TaxID=118510 RepID=A0A6L2LJJ6_TANCI|nr:putative reverse transcriptase domain-containing protein [Tanacetum cinerariifolium]